MNEHIEVVKKWLKDPDSVSKKELSYHSASTMLSYSDAATLCDAAWDTVNAAEEAAEAANAAFELTWDCAVVDAADAAHSTALWSNAVALDLAFYEAAVAYGAASYAAKAANFVMYATEAATEGNDLAADYWVEEYEDLSK